jgi:hypothetical protein
MRELLILASRLLEDGALPDRPGGLGVIVVRRRG